MKKVIILFVSVVLATTVVYPQVGICVRASSFTIEQAGLKNIKSDLAPSISIFFEDITENYLKVKFEVEYVPTIYAQSTPSQNLTGEISNTFGVSMLAGWSFFETGIKFNVTQKSTFWVEDPNKNWIIQRGIGSLSWVFGISQRITKDFGFVIHYCHKTESDDKYPVSERKFRTNSISLGLIFDIQKF